MTRRGRPAPSADWIKPRPHDFSFPVPLARPLAFVLLVTAVLSLVCASDTLPPNAAIRAEAAAGLQRWYGGTTYRSAQWWQSANALEATIDYMQATPAGPERPGAVRANPHRGRATGCATLTAMSTDSRPAAAQLRQASPMPLKPSLDGIEEKWSRRWEEAGVVQV